MGRNTVAMYAALGVLALVLSLLSPASGAATPVPTRGGVLKIAQKAEPDTLDIMWSTGDLTYWIASQIFEMLLALDEERQPVPHLARNYTVSNDGLTHTFQLRRGVKFHNGEEMTSDDAVASLRRWLDMSALGRSIIGPRTAEIVARDRYTVEWRLRAPTSVLPYALARWTQGAAIYPAKIARAAGQRMITDYIGTGPYRFVEWKRGTMVRLARFDDYQPVDRPPSGAAGRRTAYLDELHYLFVPEPAVAMVGIEAGDFHFAIEADREAYTRYRFSRKVQSFLGKRGMVFFVPNHQGPVLSNLKIRQAIQAAVCVEPILAVYTNEKFYQKVPAVTGTGPFATDVGRELYNQCNPARARQLLAEAGYDGRPVRVLLTAGDQVKIDMNLVLQQQLAGIGVNYELLIRDSAAYGRIRRDRSAYDAVFTESSWVEHPTLLSHLPATGLSGWRNEEKERLIGDLLAARTHEQALEIWRRIERLWYQDVATVKIGNFFGYAIARFELQGYTDRPFPFFWNVWLQKR
jgi:peptide/nickel transport system substrate-binding protein